MRNFTIFEQNEATIPSFIHKTILKHQDKEIHQILKEEHVIWSVLAHFRKMQELFQELEKD